MAEQPQLSLDILPAAPFDESKIRLAEFHLFPRIERNHDLLGRACHAAPMVAFEFHAVTHENSFDYANEH